MYHPDAMMKFAHDREVELLNEAERFGLRKAEAPGPRWSEQTLAIALGIAILATLLSQLIG